MMRKLQTVKSYFSRIMTDTFIEMLFFRFKYENVRFLLIETVGAQQN